MKKSDAPEALLTAASHTRPLTRNDVTEMVVMAKVKKGLTWAKVAKAVGQSKEWTTAALLGQMQMTRQQAEAAGKLLGLSPDAIQVMLVTHAKWRTFTQRPFPPAGSCGLMLSLALESRAAVDAMNEAAAAHGGQADVNPMEDHGFMYTRDLADPDGHLWAALWMDPAAMPAG